MNPSQYLLQHPDLALMHIGSFFFVIGIVGGWILWASDRQQLRDLEQENQSISSRLRADCQKQSQLEQAAIESHPTSTT